MASATTQAPRASITLNKAQARRAHIGTRCCDDQDSSVRQVRFFGLTFGVWIAVWMHREDRSSRRPHAKPRWMGRHRVPREQGTVSGGGQMTRFASGSSDTLKMTGVISLAIMR